MGSCVSVHKDMASAVKLRLSIQSKTETLFVPSPVKETLSPARPGRPGRGGSKDEAFFDSQPWLESDCEDDFLSVNGDFTPSRGSTPVHHSFSGIPRISNARLTERTTMDPTSPPDKKKRLSEFFKESLHSNELPDEGTTPNVHQIGTHVRVRPDETMGLGPSPISNGGTPSLSRPNSTPSSARAPNFGGSKKEEKALRSGQCCLPRLLLSRSFSERRNKATSPVGKG